MSETKPRCLPVSAAAAGCRSRSAPSATACTGIAWSWCHDSYQAMTWYRRPARALAKIDKLREEGRLAGLADQILANLHRDHSTADATRDRPGHRSAAEQDDPEEQADRNSS